MSGGFELFPKFDHFFKASSAPTVSIFILKLYTANILENFSMDI